MPPQEILIMAVTHMHAGVCTAGFTREPDPVSRLRWVRPVSEHSNVLLGDLTDAEKRVIQPDDVVELHLQRPHPNPPHVEDWITDFIYHRPRLLRRLEGERRARFLAEHLDLAPEDMLGRNPSRSLCLIRPDQFWASFSLDPYSLKYEARIGFVLGGNQHSQANSPRGVSVTDLKWRALGRSWLGNAGGELKFGDAELRERIGAQEVYLALGLSRDYQGKTWLLVIGVHAVPDYHAEIDYGNL